MFDNDINIVYSVCTRTMYACQNCFFFMNFIVCTDQAKISLGFTNDFCSCNLFVVALCVCLFVCLFVCGCFVCVCVCVFVGLSQHGQRVQRVQTEFIKYF